MDICPHSPCTTRAKDTTEAKTDPSQSEEEAAGSGDVESVEEEQSGDEASVLGSGEEEASEDNIERQAAKRNLTSWLISDLSKSFKIGGQCLGNERYL